MQPGFTVLWAPAHFPNKMLDIRPHHPPLSRLLTAPGPGFCHARWYPISHHHCPSVGELPVLGLPQLTPKLETMGVRALLPHSLPLGCAHFLPAGCLRKWPCPGTVWSGLCFPRGHHPWSFQSQCLLWSQHNGTGTHTHTHTPPMQCPGLLDPQGQTPGFMSKPPILHSLCWEWPWASVGQYSKKGRVGSSDLRMYRFVCISEGVCWDPVMASEPAALWAPPSHRNIPLSLLML